ncbi:glycosyltransferase [Rufibacter soli]
MEYWILTTEYPPFYGGGISTYCKFTAEMLSSKGHQVSVFIQDFTVSDISEELINGVRVIRFLPQKTKTNRYLGYSAQLSYEFAEVIRRFMKQEGVPDVLEAQEYGGIAYYVQQFKLLGYPLFRDLNIVITCHAPGFICLEYNQVPIYQFPEYWTGQMEKACMASADLLIVPSRFFVAEAQKRMPWGDIQEVYLANPMQLEDGACKEGPDFSPQQIVCFGKLAPLKGTFELLCYFEKMWQYGHAFQLSIVGGVDLLFHPEGRTMGDLVKKKYGKYIANGLLKLHGELAPDKARSLIQQAHVVLVPSLFDNLPYTVLEAMAWGKVVLASKQGGQNEIIEDGVTGFLFDHGTSGEFEKKLLQILGLSAQEIRQIGGRAITAINQRYHPEVIYPQKMKLLEENLFRKQRVKVFPFVEPQQEPTFFIPEVKENSDLLSVVIPYYNMGAYLEQCIKSIIDSDYPIKEILVIDDGSTEPESQEMLRVLQEKYGFTVFSKENEGLSATRNYGAARAKGQYLAFLDADDAVEKTYYCKAISVLKAYQNVHFVGCWVQYFEGNTSCWPSFNPEPPYLLLHNMVNSSALVYKKSSFLQAGLNDPALVYGMEDWDSVIGLVENGFRGVVLPELLFYYRVRKDSMTRSFTRVKKLFLHKHIADKHASLYRRYGLELLHLSTSNGSGLGFDNPTLRGTGESGTRSVQARLKEKFGERVKRSRSLRKIAYFIYKKIN